jgi:hypothetical protein
LVPGFPAVVPKSKRMRFSDDGLRASGRQFDNEELHPYSVAALLELAKKGKVLTPAAAHPQRWHESNEQALAEVGIPLLLCKQIIAKMSSRKFEKIFYNFSQGQSAKPLFSDIKAKSAADF